MTTEIVQEYKLFRICLALTFIAPLAFLPLEHYFVQTPNRWWMYGIIVVSVLYSTILFKQISMKNIKNGILIFISLHLLLDTLAVYLHSSQYLVVTFVLTYTFIIVFNVILMPWPLVLIMDGVIFMCAVSFILLPVSGFMSAIKMTGVATPFAITAILVYYALVLIVGTSIVEIKRRTESQLRNLNQTLNKRVEEKVEEFKRADRAARQYQEQLVRILRNIPVGVIIINQELNMLYSNGVHFPEVTDNPKNKKQDIKDSCLPLEVLHEHFLGDRARRIWEQQKDLIGQRLEYCTPDGKKKVIRFSYVYVQLPGENEDQVRLVLITEDITQEEAIREKMIQTNHLAGMGKMAAGLVHEINNPLAGIRLNLELLEMGLTSQDKREQVFHALSEGVERIDRIVKSFLSFARQDQPQKMKTDIHVVLQDILIMSANFKQFHRITIQTEFAHDMPLILADRYRLEQVFVNLLNNACDAMEKKGGTLKIVTKIENRIVVIQFQDDGIGIKKEDLPYIFSPFFTTKERGHGTGLGLSTSYGIIHEHGGSIEVESREGNGSVFSVCLPVEGEDILANA